MITTGGAIGVIMAAAAAAGLFDYGELRLLLLAMIAERPCHGYELIKAIEERFGGSYTPSPGVIYPTLSWLDDMGYAAIEAEEAGRKHYRITSEGEAFLVANREAADALLARADPTGAAGGGPCRRRWCEPWKISSSRCACASGKGRSIKRRRKVSPPRSTRRHKRSSAR